MSNLSDSKFRPYMLVSYIKRPAPGQNTSQKNWGKTGEWAVEESVVFVERLKDKHVLQSHVVIDILKGKVRHNRFDDAGDEEVYKHFVEKYSEDVQRALSVWMQRQVARGVISPADIVNEAAEKTNATNDVVSA
jgi:hypothetical protein